MKPVILFRESREQEEELQACREIFPDVVTLRSQVPKDSFVIGRYSVLPFYEELYKDLAANNSQLVNTPSMHQWIAGFHWYHDLKEFTPQTWDDYSINEAPRNIAYVVKGRTNSRKHQWSTKMFAPNRTAALDIGNELASDALIADQGVIYREYVPLKTFEIGLNGLPFTNEYRFFLLGKIILASGFYWSIMEEADKMPPAPEEAVNLVLQVSETASKWANFYVVDVAQTEQGDWMLVELNDGQQSGLSMIEPRNLYRSLRDIVG